MLGYACIELFVLKLGFINSCYCWHVSWQNRTSHRSTNGFLSVTFMDDICSKHGMYERDAWCTWCNVINAAVIMMVDSMMKRMMGVQARSQRLLHRLCRNRQVSAAEAHPANPAQGHHLCDSFHRPGCLRSGGHHHPCICWWVPLNPLLPELVPFMPLLVGPPGPPLPGLSLYHPCICWCAPLNLPEFGLSLMQYICWCLLSFSSCLRLLYC